MFRSNRRAPKMIRSILPLLLFPADAFAHAGHGAPFFHFHEWTGYNWVVVIALVVVPAVAVWRSR